MMATCGFASGAGDEVRALVAAARAAGALGAKLTGAGGGGAIFALARPGEEEYIAAALRAPRGARLRDSLVFVAPISREGLRVRTMIRR